MANAVKPIPDGYHTVTPYLVASNPGKLIDFLTSAFDAKVIERLTGPDGNVAHAEMSLGDSRIMIGGARPGQPATQSTIYLYVPDTDALYKQAVGAGGVSIMAPVNQFYGDRNAGVKDAEGNQWYIATHVEDVAPDELQKRMEAAYGQQKKSAT